MNQMEDDGKGVFARVSDLFFNMSRKQLWIVIALVIGAAIVHDRGTEPTKIRRFQTTEPYLWPAGCAAKRYNVSDEISCTCADPKYAILDARRRGIYPGGKRGDSEFYRIENDAVAISRHGHFSEPRISCSVQKIESDFIQFRINDRQVSEK
jgi:hypothetical protein